MKAICTILVVCLAGASVAHFSKLDNLIVSNLQECQNELNIPDLTKISRSTGADQSDQTSFSCLMFCMLKKQGAFNENGTPRRKLIVESIMRAAPERKKEMEKLIDLCEKKVRPLDGCKMAACVMNHNLQYW